jgi:hypothetical protein
MLCADDVVMLKQNVQAITEYSIKCLNFCLAFRLHNRYVFLTSNNGLIEQSLKNTDHPKTTT